MKIYTLTILLFFALILVCDAKQENKPVVIITQDGEVDDRSSFVRFLLYTSDVDLRGVIATNSKWQKSGHGLDWIHKAYGLYGQVRNNLLLHNRDYKKQCISYDLELPQQGTFKT